MIKPHPTDRPEEALVQTRHSHLGWRATPIAVGAALVTMLTATMPANAQDGDGTARLATKADQATTKVAKPQLRGIPVRAGVSSIQADKLADELGPKRTAGVYFDRKTQRMVVTVTDARAEQAVTKAGAITKRVKHSTKDLKAVTDALDERIDTSGTTWGTDVDDNRINVTADSTVSDAEFAGMKAVLKPYGDAARLTRVGGTFELGGAVNGGKYMRSDDGYQCSAGFNVRKKDNPGSLYLLTAGHCTVNAAGVSDWYNGAGTYFGYDAGGRYPGTDYGLIKHNNADISKPGNVYWHGSGQVTDITHSRDPGFGEYVCFSGYRYGTACGTVYELNVTVRYSSGNEVRGLFRTDHCTVAGDSGGAVFHGDAALGINSGFHSENSGSNPPGGCISYQQPVNPALAWYDVEVY
jgi:hypothetical protein